MFGAQLAPLEILDDPVGRARLVQHQAKRHVLSRSEKVGQAVELIDDADVASGLFHHLARDAHLPFRQRVSPEDGAQQRRFAAAGDFNSDNAVDEADLLKWQRDFPGSTAGDLANWQTNFGAALAPPVVGAVPEPTGLALTLAALTAMTAAAARLRWSCSLGAQCKRPWNMGECIPGQVCTVRSFPPLSRRS